jgi:UDP-2,3-diacylglucosamine hydrolase
MTTLFISDLHLEAERPELTRIFLDFLASRAGKVDALYILGDLFEAWVGDDDHSEFNQTILSALHQFVGRGSQLFVMVGNRDFLLGPDFAKAAQATLIPDPCQINLYGQPTLLMHGDSLCTQDLKHMAFRQQTQNPLFRQAVLQKPLAERIALARMLRQQSQLNTRELAMDIMDVTESAYHHALADAGLNLLIHGHTHRPGFDLFKLNDQLALRIVLSDWDDNQGHALVCQPNGDKQLISFKE